MKKRLLLPLSILLLSFAKVPCENFSEPESEEAEIFIFDNPIQFSQIHRFESSLKSYPFPKKEPKVDFHYESKYPWTQKDGIVKYEPGFKATFNWSSEDR